MRRLRPGRLETRMGRRDPDDILREEGAEALHRQLNAAQVRIDAAKPNGADSAQQLPTLEPHDRDAARDAIASMRRSSTTDDKFAALRAAGTKLHPVTSSEALDLVTWHAIDIEQLDPDLVQAALAAGCANSPKPKQNGKGKQAINWRKGAAKGKDIRTMIFNPVTFLVRDLIPNEGITLICAKPKVGKSWLVLDVALASTMDRYVLGDIKPVQGDVLYLALEDSLRRIQARMTKLLPTFTEEWPEGLTFATQWRRVDQGGLDDIREWAAETKAKGRNIAFIAIDVLKMVRPPSKAGQPPYEADYEAIKGLHQLAIELGVPIVVIHHTRKQAAEDLIDTVSGTAGLTGAVDTIIVIERQSQGTVFDVRGRDIEANSLAVEFNKNTCRWTILGPAAEFKRSDNQAKIIEALRQAAGPLGPKKVTEVTGMTEDNAKQSLSRMAKNGEIVRVGRGEYTLSDHPYLSSVTSSLCHFGSEAK
jgi:hypothetical protein